MDVGRTAILNLLARVGIPLAECEQPWAHMSRRSRLAVRTRLAARAAQMGVIRTEYPSFTRQMGFGATVAAHDVALAVTALLESGGDAGVLAAATLADEAAAVAAEAGLSAAAARALAPTGTAAASRAPGAGASAQLDSWASGFSRAFEALTNGDAGRRGLRAGVLLAQRQLRGIARLTPRLVRSAGQRAFAGVLNVVSHTGIMSTSRAHHVRPKRRCGAAAACGGSAELQSETVDSALPRTPSRHRHRHRHRRRHRQPIPASSRPSLASTPAPSRPALSPRSAASMTSPTPTQKSSRSRQRWHSSAEP